MRILWVPSAALTDPKDACPCGAKLPARVIIDAEVTCHGCAVAKLEGRA